MYKPLSADDLALVSDREFYDGLDILYEDLRDMQIESSKKRFDVLRSEATNRYGVNNFLEFIDHTLKRAYYIKLSDADAFMKRFDNRLCDLK